VLIEPDAMVVAGAVLVGGASRRMGTDKALIEIAGQPMARRCADALRECGLSPVVAVGGSPEVAAFIGLPHLSDEWPGAGPLGALISALDQIDADVVVVLSCDLLNPTPAAIRQLCESLDDHDAVIPLVNGRAQWLHGAWNRRTAALLRQRFEGGERSLHGAVAGMDVRSLTVQDPVPYRDVDSPSDLPPGSPRSNS